jgi:hypothetical protein
MNDLSNELRRSGIIAAKEVARRGEQAPVFHVRMKHRRARRSDRAILKNRTGLFAAEQKFRLHEEIAPFGRTVGHGHIAGECALKFHAVAARLFRKGQKIRHIFPFEGREAEHFAPRVAHGYPVKGSLFRTR